MDGIRKGLLGTPLRARALPFVVFAGLTLLQGRLGPESAYWIYAGKTVVGAWLVWLMWPLVAEMRWAWSWEAVVAGVVVFGLWVGLDPLYPHLSSGGEAWNPHRVFGEGSAVAWALVVWRVLGSTLVVPPLEEVFYRSFIYRLVVQQDFQAVALGAFHSTSFLVTAGLFGLAHNEWLAGILCGMIYQWLVIRKGRLGDAMTAHAITNFLLGIWVIWRGAWGFW